MCSKRGCRATGWGALGKLDFFRCLPCPTPSAETAPPANPCITKAWEQLKSCKQTALDLSKRGRHPHSLMPWRQTHTHTNWEKSLRNPPHLSLVRGTHTCAGLKKPDIHAWLVHQRPLLGHITVPALGYHRLRKGKRKGGERGQGGKERERGRG